MAHDMTQDELQMYEKLYKLMGAKVKLSCEGYDYEGIIGAIIPELRRVNLRQAKFVNNGDPVGNLHFRFKDISSLALVESKEIVNNRRNDYVLRILKNASHQKYDIYADVLYEGNISDVSDEEKSVVEEAREEEFTLQVPDHLKNQLPNVSVVIDFVDANFTEAVRHIFKQSAIGVSFEGPQLSRFQKLVFFCISTVSHVYVFDIESLNFEAFDNGLRDILEDPSIKKIIHDCRFLSDCLSHQYSTQLTNVFDTQVAEFVGNMQRFDHERQNFKWEYISDLDSLIISHLNVPYQFLRDHVTDLPERERKAYLSRRPIGNALRHDLTKKSLYLILLYEELTKCLLDPLHKNVSTYLTVLAKASNAEIEIVGSEISPPDSLPPAILMYGIQTARFQQPDRNSAVSLECKFVDPKTGEILESSSNKEALHSEGIAVKISESVKKVSVSNSKSDPKTSMESTPTAFEENSKIFDSIVMQPSIRHLDEVYHKLVNSMHLCNYGDSMVNVKPLSNYVSRFTVRKPLSYNAPSEKTSGELSTHHDVSSNSLYSAKDAPDANDIWLKIAASSETPSCKLYKQIRFVPSGME